MVRSSIMVMKIVIWQNISWLEANLSFVAKTYSTRGVSFVKEK